MFFRLFFGLRTAGLPVSLREHLTLIEATVAATDRSIDISRMLLLALNGVSLVGAVLIGWLYVKRSFTDPVLRVTNAAPWVILNEDPESLPPMELRMDGAALPLVEKVAVLAEFGFASDEPVEVNGAQVTPREFLIAMMGGYVPPITEFLKPPANQPPNWTKEIVTEVKGTKDGKIMTYRLGTLTVKGALPTGVAPARGAVWQAAGRVEAGVMPPELAFDPAAFLKELEVRDIFTQVTVTEGL